MVFWRPQEWLVPVLYGWPLLNGVVAVCVMAMVIEKDQGHLRLKRGPIPYLLGGLYLATLMSHVAHTYLGGVLYTIPETFKPIFFTFLLFNVLDRPDRIRTFAFVFVAMCCVMALHALMQAELGYGFRGARPLTVFTPERGTYTRSQFFGIFGDPNDLAQILVTAIPLTFAIPRRMNFIKFAFCMAVALFLFKAAGTTESRGGTVALVAVLAVLAAMRLPQRWMPGLVAIGLVTVLALCAFWAGALLDPSAQERVVFWGMANDSFKSNPIFGIGYDMFWQVASSRASHNAFVGCYTELGLFGYWMWFGILLLGVLGCWRTRRALARPRSGTERYLYRASGMAIAAVTGFSAGAYFLSRTFLFPYFFLFALINALPLVAQRFAGEERLTLHSRPGEVVRIVTLGTIASIIFIYATIVLLNKAFYG